MQQTGYILLGDMVASREVEAPERLRDAMDQTIGRINQRCRDEFTAPLELIKGIDELAAMFHRAEPIFDVVAALHLELWPHRFRFGLAAGPVEPARAPISAMTGPGLHRAADALARAHQAELPLALAVPGLDPATAELVEATVLLHDTIRRHWTGRTAAVVRTFAALPPQHRTQAIVAERVGITQQAVSKALHRAELNSLTTAEHALRASLATFPAAGDR